MRDLRAVMASLFLLLTLMVQAQSTITGTVVDEEAGTPLPGVNIIEKGTSNGASTDFDGNFTLITRATTGTVEISYVGFATKTVKFTGDLNIGQVVLQMDNTLEEVIIVGGGILDLAKDRQTPVAVSTIKASEIQERLGNQELPELLNATPSVYATKSGGGYGDSRINIRGFDQRNTAVLINGVPVNDMENGSVFWSNWTGLADVASGIQVQRGLGSSKLAISSVGGTLNIVTKSTDRQKGGFVGTTVGNDGYNKTLASVSTGKMENGFAFTGLLGRTSGDGYINGTSFESYNYFMGLGWSDKTDTHSLGLIVTGSPQVHDQRTTSFFNAATLADYERYGDKYNFNHGTLNGEDFGWRRNFYHKPVLSINWDWAISDNSSLSTVAYASYGRGGGTGDIGRLDGDFASDSKFRDPDTGFVQWDEIIASNSGGTGTFSDGTTFSNPRDPYTGTFVVNNPNISSGDLPGITRRNGIVRRASVNSHNWFGVLSNFTTELNENLTLDFGFDARRYKGFHYRRLDNLLGADGYRDNNDVNNPFLVASQTNSSEFSSIVNVFKPVDDEVKIDYYNIGYVNYAGIFGQLEYTKEKISTFVQFAASNQGFRREDFFNYLDSDPEQLSDWVNILGGNIKGGLNYNINDEHNVFGNVGYYSRQPQFDSVFENFRNDINEDRENEIIFGAELGYGLRMGKLRANVNLYRTEWKNRFIRISKTFDTDGDGIGDENTNMDGPEDFDGTADDRQATVQSNDLAQVHMGLEVEATYRYSDRLKIDGMISIGNWEYKSNPGGTAFDNDGQTPLGEARVIIDGVKVGDAAQFTTRLAAQYEVIDNLRFDLSWFRADNLYGNYNADEFGDSVDDGIDLADNGGFQLKLPAYDLFDTGVSYKWDIGQDGGESLNFRLNVNNLFNTRYLAESTTNIETSDDPTQNFDGVNTRNKVFFGFGRTWNASVRYRF